MNNYKNKPAYLLYTFILFIGYIIPLNFLKGEIILYKNQETLISLPVSFKVDKYQKASFQNNEWEVNIFAENFQKGDILYFEILNHNKSRDIAKYNHEIWFNNINKKIHFYQRNFGFNSIYLIPPDINDPKIKLTWKVFKEGKLEFENTYIIDITLQTYPESEGIIYIYKKEFKKKELKEIEKRIAKEKKIKEKVFKIYRPLLIKNNLSYPLNYHQITSEWYKKRTFQYYQIENKKRILLEKFINIHRGVDLRGLTGEEVFSIADGEVVISGNFYFQGEFIVINHGNFIYSMYMHLSERTVKVGDLVKAGTLIGKVGSTGFAMGSHLHYEIRIDGYSANPLSIFLLPIR